MCKRCPAGTYNDKIGQSECKKCDIGTYSNQIGRNKRCLTNGCWNYSFFDDLDETKCQKEYDKNKNVMWIKDGLVKNRKRNYKKLNLNKDNITIANEDLYELEPSDKRGKCLKYINKKK